MEEKLIFKKGRKRPFIGKLNNFNNLSEDTQSVFKEIKEEVKSRLGSNMSVYVYGSYFWGYSDSNSDYDVRIELEDLENLNEVKKLYELSTNVTNKIGKDTHIVCVQKERAGEGAILIP